MSIFRTKGQGVVMRRGHKSRSEGDKEKKRERDDVWSLEEGRVGEGGEGTGAPM